MEHDWKPVGRPTQHKGGREGGERGAKSNHGRFPLGNLLGFLRYELRASQNDPPRYFLEIFNKSSPRRPKTPRWTSLCAPAPPATSGCII